ncbi:MULTISPECIES: TauD/TfdA dioxygenase family protein [Cyanophyceae]|uniref:TauD/TfdA family dioxygenase n=1 Tax=Leptolyngbya subtilissima DQ-A4 TaxID=2933933 RepID=A0ABV0JZT5_9CYAN|nr:TauD/TfdA family dioxygenase [Nodosilinea sp. FACHB-141]MBD2112339.1 TauD/TfdA family dioxygenase [Nodosilinea sp. FACHB-141]
MSSVSLRPVALDFDIQPLSGRIGAEIRGVNLRKLLGDRPSGPVLDHGTVAAIRQALLKYKVIFFRNQSLDDPSQVAFARCFGDITGAHPTVAPPTDHPAVLDIDYGRTPSRTNFWHTDVTFVDRPPLGSVLRVLELPPAGGDTLWANTITAYQDLPPCLKTLADSAWAIHSNAYDYAAAPQSLSAEARAFQEKFSATVYETLHPVVRVHPETQERCLFLGGFVRHLRGLSTFESADVLRMLQSYVTRPENTVRWRWQLGDVAFWDNRATQHYGVYDYDGQPRRVRRVTVAGDLPINANGETSLALKGDSAAYNGLSAVAS